MTQNKTDAAIKCKLLFIIAPGISAIEVIHPFARLLWAIVFALGVPFAAWIVEANCPKTRLRLLVNVFDRHRLSFKSHSVRRATRTAPDAIRSGNSSSILLIG